MNFNYSKFVKSNDSIVKIDEIIDIDCSNIENLIVTVTLSTKKQIIFKDIEALELIMQVKPSMLEGKRINGYKAHKLMWIVHNVIAHPLLQLFALLRMYKIAFYIHEATVPKHIKK